MALQTTLSVSESRPSHQHGPRDWAKALLADRDWLILDTETTGLDHTAEVIQVGLLGADGAVLLDAMAQPLDGIPEAARRVHGITEQEIADAPTFPEVWEKLAALVNGRHLVVYNAHFDRTLLEQTTARYGLPTLNVEHWDCAMLQYAEWVGEWNDYRGGYRWQKLPRRDWDARHRAIDDCRDVLALIERMAA